MNTLIQEQLERLKHHATAYELHATNGSQSILVCYCRKTKPGLINALTRTLNSGSRRIDLLSVKTSTKPESWTWEAGAAVKSGEWRVHFSGRTEREAIIAGELPSIY